MSGLALKVVTKVITVFALGALLALPQTSVAQDFEPQGIKLGVDWLSHREGWGVDIELFSPRLLNWGEANERNSLSLFLGWGAVILPNLPIVGGGFEEASNNKLALGLHVSAPGVAQTFRPFANISMNWLFVDERAFSKTSNLGGALGIGAEFPYARAERTPFGQSLGAFYVQSDFEFGHGRADKLGGLDLFNGVNMRVGVRASY